MTTFIAFDIDLQLDTALILIPVAAIGHIIGLKMHDIIMQNDQLIKCMIGAALLIVCIIGLWKVTT